MMALKLPPADFIRESMLSVQVLRGIAEAVEQAGVSRVQLFTAANCDVALLDCPEASVPRSDVYRLCELAIELTADPAFGLHWAERLSAATFDPLASLVAHSASLRQCFKSLFTFYRLFGDEPSFQLSEQATQVNIRYLNPSTRSVVVQRFLSENFVTGIVRLVRNVVPQGKIERVNFEYSAPEYCGEYARVFERTVHFDQPFTGIVFDRALMDTVSPHNDGDVHDALQAIAERRVLRGTQCAPYSLRVRERLVQQGPARHIDMNSVARSLGLSARSLRRRLSAEGKPYHAVVSEALAIIAKQYLGNRQLTIQEVAYEMGFADTSTFHRAFKRWTGMTPSEVRLGHAKGRAAHATNQ